MLNITAQHNAAGAKSYFAKADYYSEGQEIIGSWHGKAAKLLGLSGEVQQKDFHSMCDNINPNTGKPLTAKTLENRRVGYDFTWSATKSVSLVHALTGDERIVAAFQTSIHETMSEMEADMQTRVRKSGSDSDRTTGNFCYAEFVHLTSRPVNGIPSPQLHSHTFCFNATMDPVENKWKAGQFGQIKHDAYYWQASQQVRFANKLQELGYGIHKTKDAFEITGVPLSAIHKFSQRTKIIEQVAERLNITDPKLKARLASTTREKKNDELPYSQLKNIWCDWLSAEEASAITKEKLLHEPQALIFDDQAAVRFAVDHSFERASIVDEKRLLATALRFGIGQVTPKGVQMAADLLQLLKKKKTMRLGYQPRKSWRRNAK